MGIIHDVRTYVLIGVLGMKFTLWGRIEGIRATTESALWVGAQHGIVTDLSQMARAGGIRPGFKVSAALALVPGLEVCELQDEATAGVQKVWQAVYKFTPWLETETTHQNGFCAQIAAEGTPFEEVHELMKQLVELLPEDARLTLGLARSPAQARALVEWHGWHLNHGGALPAGLVVRFEPHALLCDPLLLTPQTAASLQQPRQSSLLATDPRRPNWLDKLPIGAAWFLPETAQKALPGLGIHTYGEFRRTASHRLLRMFGSEAAVWSRWFEMTSASIQCNYPPQSVEQSWQAAAGESISRDCFVGLVSELLPPIAKKLERSGLGAGLIALHWQTEVGKQCWQRRLKRSVATLQGLRVLLAPAEQVCEGKWIEQMTLVVSEIQPRQAVQATIIAQEGFASFVESPENTLHQTCTRLEKRFPGRIAIGLKPSFRELRWRAVADG